MDAKERRMTEIKELELSDGSTGYDLRITAENADLQIAIACISEQQAIELKKLLEQTVSIELM